MKPSYRFRGKKKNQTMYFVVIAIDFYMMMMMNYANELSENVYLAIKYAR